MKKKVATNSKSSYKSIVPAVDQGLQVLNCLAESESPQLTLTEICDRLGIHKSRAYTILNTFIEYDFIAKNAQTKTYCLGLGIVNLSRNILNNMEIRDIVLPHLKTLTNETHLTAHFGLIAGPRLYIIAKEESNQRFGYNIRVGTYHPITHGAHGKAIFTFMSETEKKQTLEKNELCFYGDGKPVDMDRLEDEMRACRQTGYAVDHGETNPNITAISSPVFNSKGLVMGAVILIGGSYRLKTRKLGTQVLRAAADISRKLGYNGSDFPTTQ